MQFLKHKCDFCYVGTFIALQAGQFNAWIGSQISKAVKIVAPFYHEMECRWNKCLYFLSKIKKCPFKVIIFRVFKFYKWFCCVVETFANYLIDQFYETDQIQTQSNFFAKYDVAIKCNFAGLRLVAWYSKKCNNSTFAEECSRAHFYCMVCSAHIWNVHTCTKFNYLRKTNIAMRWLKPNVAN